MKVAKNKDGKFIKILSSNENETYNCIACGKPVIRAWGLQRKFFTHEHEASNRECEKKIKVMLRKSESKPTSIQPIITNNPIPKKVIAVEEIDEPTPINPIVGQILSKEKEVYAHVPETNDKGFNAEQWESITDTDGYIGVSGVPGGGKTRALIGKIGYLINEKNIDPKRILCISFTNKVVEEMKERLETLVGFVGVDVTISTMHSLSLNLLKKYGLIKGKSIIKDWQILSFFQKEYKLDDAKYLKSWKPNDVLMFINMQKSRCKSYHNMKLEPALESMREELYDVFCRYEKYKEQLNVIDFADMLYLLWISIKDKNGTTSSIQELYDYILFDEFNDANDLQLEIIKTMSEKVGNVTFYYDARQSIYSFNGSNVQLTLGFLDIFPTGKIINFYYNYRSNSKIIDASNAIIEEYKHPLFYPVLGTKKEAGIVELHRFFNVEYEARFVAEKIRLLVDNYGYKYSEFFVIGRTNARANMIEDSFIKNKIPYYRKNSISFMDRREIKDILSYLEVIQNNSSSKIERILNVPNRYLGNEAIDRIKSYAEGNNISMYDSLIQCKSLSDKQYWIKGASELHTKINKYSKLKLPKLSQLIEFILEDLDYYSYLKKVVVNDDNFEDKVENLKSLIKIADTFDDLNSMIKSFENSYAEMQETNKNLDKVELMTIHGVKGLENRICFVIGLEQGVLPHFMSKDIEEERRMAYVAVSRAMQGMYITYTERHYLKEDNEVFPSQFLKSLDGITEIIKH